MRVIGEVYDQRRSWDTSGLRKTMDSSTLSPCESSVAIVYATAYANYRFDQNI